MEELHLSTGFTKAMRYKKENCAAIIGYLNLQNTDAPRKR